MKKIIIASICVVGLFSNVQVSSAATVTLGDAVITAGEAIDLNWDSLNVTGRLRTNDYIDTLWSGSAPATNASGVVVGGWTPSTLGYSRGTIKYPVGHFTRPGMFRFDYYITDDDAPNQTWNDWAYLTVLPRPPVALNGVTCTGTNAALSWNPAPHTTGGRVMVYKPIPVACPAGWNTVSAGSACELVVGGSSVNFPFNSGTTYTSWQVYSLAGTLESINPTATLVSFTCTNPPSVDLQIMQ